MIRVHPGVQFAIGGKRERPLRDEAEDPAALEEGVDEVRGLGGEARGPALVPPHRLLAKAVDPGAGGRTEGWKAIWGLKAGGGSCVSVKAGGASGPPQSGRQSGR